MLHDRDLLDRLSAYTPVRLDCEAFRATRRGLDGLASSTSGGRWMFADQMPTLYTSTEAEGALAEISYHWSKLNPVPKKPVALHRLKLAATKSLRLARGDLTKLDVDWSQYTSANYNRMQAIGAAVAHLECDGLVVPSARWACDNIIVFVNNQIGDQDGAILLDTREIDWLSWARAHDMIGD